MAQADYSTLLLLNRNAVSGVTIACDLWMDFEFSATAGGVTTTKLEAQDHYATTGITAMVDGSSLLSTNTTGQQNMINKPQGLTDAGLGGLQVDLGTAAAALIQWTLPTTNNLNWGMWIKTDDITSGNKVIIGGVEDSGISACTELAFANSAGTYRFEFTLGSVSGNVNVSADTWYYVTLTYVRGGTCNGYVFDTSGTQVGSTVTGTDSNNRVPAYWRGGRFSGSTGTDSGKFLYYDNLIIAWTPTFTDPLLP